ncbi:YqjD family protein [Niveibacterium sp. COAC-50]|uniref:DUF883 family protein n=1 Tax=Niveibacterium sp. COAC-50 TaxID=2729384 RepID=UPI001553A61F|nr:DUF883 family protein [Niveibacterium sp. COAC-50]
MNTELNPVTGIGSKDRLAVDLKHVVADTSGLIQEIAAATASDLAQVQTKVAQSFDDAKTYAINSKGALGEKVRGAAIATDGYVRTNPWKTVGATALAGLVIGFMFSRR